jgi:hypothetical protein
MIDYALKEPKNPNNFQLNIEVISLYSEKTLQSLEMSNFYKSAYKFPFISSEILSSEINFILDKILPQSDYQNLEESKSYFLNLSTDSFSVKKEENALNVQDEIGINLTLENEIKKEQNYEKNFLFNPPEIEYGYDKEKEKMSLFFYSEKEKFPFASEKERFSPQPEFNLSLKDISFNTSLDRKMPYYNLDMNSYENLDYILSFLNPDLNSIQSSYFKKIICSLLRNSNKNLIVLKYFCFRKSEILFNLLNNLHNREICEIILKLLLTVDVLSLEENSQNYENLKLTIFNKLITNMNMNVLDNIHNIDYTFLFTCSNVSEIFIEYIENTKYFEFLISESFLNMFTQFLGNMKNKFVIREFLKVANSLMKIFKIEYEKAQKLMNSISMSNIFNNYIILFRIKNFGKNKFFYIRHG